MGLIVLYLMFIAEATYSDSIACRSADRRHDYLRWWSEAEENMYNSLWASDGVVIACP